MQNINWLHGTWNYYQPDGTFLFKCFCAKTRDDIFEFRLLSWNETIYGNCTFEAGRLITAVTLVSHINTIQGSHYSVEDGSFYAPVTLTQQESKTKLVLSSFTGTGCIGQYYEKY